VFGLMALSVVAVLWLAWRSELPVPYLALLSTTLGLMLTPYAGQYDYPPMILALYWVYPSFPAQRARTRWWFALVVLLFVFSVLFWEGPAYDGYWVVLGMVALLLMLEPRLWRRGPRKAMADG
jgi:hypothetical protein